jgi:multidrug efflux pump subunit AcrA (membrane-fusion protein)
VIVLAVLLFRQAGAARHGDPSDVPATPARSPVAVKVLKLTTEETQESGEFSGSVQSRKVVQVSAEILARIEKLPVSANQKVKKGELLAQLDSSVIETKVKQAEEALGSAEAMVRQAEARVRQAQAGVRSAEATRDQAQRDQKRYEETFKAGASTQQQLQQAESLLKTTTEAVQGAKEEVDAAQRQVDAVLRQAEGARQQIEEVRAQSSKTAIYCPMDAVVVDRLAEPGDLASPGRALMTLQSATQLRFEAPVSESCARRVHVGDEVRVGVESAGREMVTRVNEIVPVVDPQSRTFLVRADLPALAELQPGMFGRLAFTCGLRPALRIPESALSVRGQLELVFVVQDGKAHLRLVRSGKHQDGRVEILSGLAEGEEIVVTPPPTLMDGDPVIVGQASCPERSRRVQPDLRMRNSANCGTGEAA